MQTTFKVEILRDRTRLPEVYNLRVIAWEHSEKAAFINKEHFPEGWKDKFDDNAFHWVIKYHNKIIASARVAMLNQVSDLDEALNNYNLPQISPIGFYSRMVVHPDFRGNKIVAMMDSVRINFLKCNYIPYTIAYANDKRIARLEKLGFEKAIDSLGAKYGTNPVTHYSTVLIYKPK
jgi:hypothetical protein